MDPPEGQVFGHQVELLKVSTNFQMKAVKGFKCEGYIY